MTVKPRQCFAVFPGQMRPGSGYIPSLVTEDEPGHQPLIGRGQFSEPWFWGRTLEEAQRVCDENNAKDFGLSREEAKAIVDSSIAAQIRQDARRGSAQSRYESAMEPR